MSLPEGYGFIAGRSRATAVKLLEIADTLEIEQWMVRAVMGGYQVPEAIVDKYNEFLAEQDQAIDSDSGNNDPGAVDVVAEKAPDGTVVTPENAGVVVDGAGDIHVGELPAPSALEEPKKNASRDDWIAFASAQDGWSAEDGKEDGLSRNELVKKYGAK